MTIQSATQNRTGIILVAGPGGHGKTTTVAALVDRLNTDTTRHILTVEDPIEYVHPKKRALMSQREVGTHTRNVVSGISASSREDPDVLSSGRIARRRDGAVGAPGERRRLSGDWSVNAPGAAKTITRLIEMFPAAEQVQVRGTLANSLRLVVSQLLLPNIEGTKLVVAAEVLPGGVPLSNLIREGRTIESQLSRSAAREGDSSPRRLTPGACSRQLESRCKLRYPSHTFRTMSRRPWLQRPSWPTSQGWRRRRRPSRCRRPGLAMPARGSGTRQRDLRKEGELVPLEREGQ